MNHRASMIAGGVSRIGLLLAGFGLSLTIAGCWPLLAMQLAPMGLHAAEAVTVNTANSVTGTDPIDDPDEDAAKCDQLKSAVPYVTEVRIDGAGGFEIRQFGVSASPGKSRWAIIPARDGAPDGWRPEADIAQLDFTPPLPAALAVEHGRYLVFAPAEAANANESEQVVSFISSFGPADGTFRWGGRLYNYAVVRKLPCFRIAS